VPTLAFAVPVRGGYGLVRGSASAWNRIAMSEGCVGTDVQTDGPIPGPHSMARLGSAACAADERLPSTFWARRQT